MTTNAPPNPKKRQRPTVAAVIARYTRRTGFTHRWTYGDVYAEAVTALSGDDVVLDATERLLVAMARAHRITKRRMVALLGRHITEQKAQALADATAPTGPH
jgi:hypothetical protein